MCQSVAYPNRILSESVPLATCTTAIDLDITHGCNLNCSYCFKKLDNPTSMDFKIATDSIEWLLKSSRGAPRLSVNFMGGEPTLCFPLMKKIVRWGKRRAKSDGRTVYFSLTSNMVLWNDEIRKWVDEEGIGVLMSIDGCPDVQNIQRPAKDGQDKSSVIAKWAKSMLQTRPNSDARMTITADRVNRIFDSCIYLWEEIGFSSIAMATASHEDWTDQAMDEFAEQLNLIVGYLITTEGSRKSLKSIKYYEENLVHPRQNGHLPIRRRSPCGAGHNYSMIGPDGTIWPCHRFDGAARETGQCTQIALGNIYSSTYNQKLSSSFCHLDHFRDRKGMCDICPIDPICGGACPAMNLSECGDIRRPHDRYCQIQQLLYMAAEKRLQATPHLS